MIQFLGDNHITLLQDGTEYFPALETAIDQAQQHVYLESYIFAHDAVGQRIGAALMRAAQRGVATHLVIDGYGSQQFPSSALDALRQAGVAALIFRPQISALRFPRQHLRRLHRKLAAIDEQAFVGGINIVSDAKPDLPPQFDFAVRVAGPLVRTILQEMHHLHAHLAWAQLRHARPKPKLIPEPAPSGAMRAAFVLRSNLQHRRDIERAYLRAIGQAQHEILLANPYFLPGRRFRRALRHAAQRGVKVTLLLQGQVEFRWVHYATRALYQQLLSAGITIHEYQPSILHAKVAVIDGHWATVGSSNIDPTSLFLLREANVVVLNQTFAASLHACLSAAIRDRAQTITLEQIRSGSRWQRALHWLAYSGVRLLAGWVGYRRQME